ncbi:MAG: TonB-dependent copper receptor [Steroidobacteraceae bacterium]|nr:TonB-dependent copper receptor [Nevskiaceae bacterium]MCP5340492.1 TonB-dependent copper receptor [Nevskiaceae bacterium]MCP5360176.1 TonB-dependent copper receptor [Nevskiaceae bacterium]MCP5473202.1 TonB-dependent copper receptor [Nevskiaceae bacterium]
MSKSFFPAHLLSLASLSVVAGAAWAAPPPDEHELREIVVTASRMLAPLVITVDAKAPRQPVPAHDGADYLKTVPGFAVIRKGGTDGDPVFRGMAASRVNVQIDGEQLLGGCGMRMDPPTAYVFPEVYDRIVVVKGPQTVLRGAGNSAAAVSFERAAPRYESAAFAAHGSVLAGSFGRKDLVADLELGSPRGYARLSGTHAQAQDYADGGGRDIHADYLRWSTNGLLGWTPDERTRIEFSGALSDGEAAYADRAMDGAKFARDNLGLRFERRELSARVRRLEARAFYNYVDHVMDNYNLRDFVPTTLMPGRAASNPDRRTTGAKVEVELALTATLAGTFGLERQENVHTLRSTMNETTMPYEAMARIEDGRFRSDSLYGELAWRADDRQAVIGGLRFDDWTAHDRRATLRIGMTNAANPTAAARRGARLSGGFLRYERTLAAPPATVYLGVGRVERFPDYWELLADGREAIDGLSAFGTRPEQTTQLDSGLLWQTSRLSVSLSAFASDVDDYILLQNGYRKGMRSTTVVRNVDARTWGAEADASVRLGDAWKVGGSLAWIRGENRSDATPLAQMPPLEARLILGYERTAWSLGALLRVVAAQDRYVVGQGSIVGQDIGPTGGFAILSVNAGWRPRDGLLVAAGIDNLFDREYAEHLSRAGAMISGFAQTTRVAEPGRTLWFKVSADIE